MIQASLQKTLMGQDGPMEFNMDLHIDSGEFICVYGPSGAGKSSLLRMLSGLMIPDNGSLYVDKKEWYNKERNINLAPQNRDVSFVFQKAALFPNMTVKQNLEFALANIKEQTLLNRLVNYANIDGLMHRKPNSLSGGQRQRVALVRALLRPAKLTLLDEPLASLDDQARLELQELIYNLHKEVGRTIIMVSHRLSEVIKLANRVYSINQGKIIAQGTPQELFLKTTNASGVTFMGEVLRIELAANTAHVWILLPSGQVRIQLSLIKANELKIGDKVSLHSATFKPEVHKIQD